MRKLPLVPTLLVLIVVAVLVRLGFWQLDRLHQKEVMLAEYQAAISQTAVADWPPSGDNGQVRKALQFRRTSVSCVKVTGVSAVAGHNAQGETGWSHIARCETGAGYSRAEIVLGWSRDPASPVWNGGRVSGTFLMSGQFAARLIADPPLAGLQANARPDPANIPNNHLAYAMQWFLFALTALVIYALALRKRIKGA